MDLEKLSRVNSNQARQAVATMISEIITSQRVPLSLSEQEKVESDLLDEVFGLGPLVANQLVELKSISAEMMELLAAAVRARISILISGGTGAGKTTLLNILSRYIPKHERIVTIEDAAELQLAQENIVRLETR